MSFWKQAAMALVLLGGTVVLWALYLPSARPVLESAGLADRFEALGLLPPAAPDTGPGEGLARPPAAVIATPPGEGTVNDIVTAIGTGQAARSVTLLPEAAGRIVEIAVASGEPVETGQIVVRLDSDAEQIAVDRARLVLDDARDTLERATRLRSTGTGTDLQIRSAELALRQAELALRQAEYDLARRDIRAPIPGSVGILNAEVGRQVGATTEITRIDDRSSIVVDFRVPERFVGQIAPGDLVRARPLSHPTEIQEGVVSAIDNRIDESSRTLRLQARLENTDDRLRAGMAFSIDVALRGEIYPAIDPLALQWSSDGAYVWVVRAGHATRVPVQIVQRNADSILVRAEFDEGDLVVAEGVQALRPGGPVAIQAADQGAPGDQGIRHSPGGAAMTLPAASRI